MSNLTGKLLGEEGKKWETVTSFSDRLGISTQATHYLMNKDIIDYIKLGARAAAIILTDKTNSYHPNLKRK